VLLCENFKRQRFYSLDFLYGREDINIQCQSRYVELTSHKFLSLCVADKHEINFLLGAVCVTTQKAPSVAHCLKIPDIFMNNTRSVVTYKHVLHSSGCWYCLIRKCTRWKTANIILSFKNMLIDCFKIFSSYAVAIWRHKRETVWYKFSLLSSSLLRRSYLYSVLGLEPLYWNSRMFL